MTVLLADWWQDNAVVFLLGTLAWSVCGLVVMSLIRAPVQRQRLAEATIAGWLVWLLLACLPVESGSGLEDIAPATVGSITIVTTASLPERVDTAVPTTVTSGFGTTAIDLLGIALAIGSVLASCYLLGAWLLLARLLHRAVPAPVAVVELLATLRSPQQRDVRLLVSHLAWRPFCCGLRRPCIVLPRVMLATPAHANESSLRAVLSHELAHLARGDLRGRCLFALAMPLAFWNPGFWQLRRHAQTAAELLADDVAAELHRDRVNYARSLVDLAESLPKAREVRVAALGVFGPATNFSKRMTMLLTRRNPLATRCSRLSTVVRSFAALALAAVASFGWTAPRVTAQEPQPGNPPTADAPPVPAGETAATKAAPALLRYQMQVRYTEEQDLGTIVTKLAGQGFTIEKLEIVPADAEQRSATLVVAMPNPELLNGLAKLLDPASISRCTPVVEKGRAGRQATGSKEPPRVYFAFENAEVTKVVDVIAKISGTNIVVASDVKGLVTMRVQGIPWREALEITARQVGATVTERGEELFHVEKSETTKR